MSAVNLTEAVAASGAIGTVVAQSAGRSVVLGRLGDGVAMGDRLVFEGEPAALGVVTGFETPLGESDPLSEDLILIDVRMVGVLTSEGGAERGYLQPAMGAEAFPLIDEALESSAGPVVPIGADAAGADVFLETSRLLGRELMVTGQIGTGKSACLALVARELLRSRFPARTVVLDTDGILGNAFGRAASIVDASEGLLPVHLLQDDELADLLAAFGRPLGFEDRRKLRAEREALGRGEPTGTPLGARLVELLSDPRAGLFCGEAASRMSAADVLQTVFRLPSGQPPAAVIQLHQLELALRPVAARVVLRLARDLTETAGHIVPVMLFVDRADELFGDVPQAGDPALGLVLSSEDWGGRSDAMRIAHRTLVMPRLEDPLAEDIFEQLRLLKDGEALLIDPRKPWPTRFDVTPLPEGAQPQRARSMREFPDRESLISAIAETWAKIG